MNKQGEELGGRIPSAVIIEAARHEERGRQATEAIPLLNASLHVTSENQSDRISFQVSKLIRSLPRQAFHPKSNPIQTDHHLHQPTYPSGYTAMMKAQQARGAGPPEGASPAPGSIVCLDRSR